MQYNNDIAQPLDVQSILGDTFNPSITFTDSSGNPIDVSAYTWALVMTDDTNTIVQQWDNTNIIAGGANNIITFSPPASFAELAPQAYNYVMRYTDTGNNTRTIFKGKFTIQLNV